MNYLTKERVIVVLNIGILNLSSTNIEEIFLSKPNSLLTTFTPIY